MKEKDRGEPQRSLEATITLHGIISTISERISQKGATTYQGVFNTKISHSSVFPAVNCDGDLNIVGMDNAMQDVSLECSNRCDYEDELVSLDDILVGNTSNIFERRRGTIYSLNFGDVGFITEGYKTIDGVVGHVVSPRAVVSKIGGEQLTDEDLQDLIQE